jgi:hypothetical protein
MTTTPRLTRRLPPETSSSPLTLSFFDSLCSGHSSADEAEYMLLRGQSSEAYRTQNLLDRSGWASLCKCYSPRRMQPQAWDSVHGDEHCSKQNYYTQRVTTGRVIVTNDLWREEHFSLTTTPLERLSSQSNGPRFLVAHFFRSYIYCSISNGEGTS